MSLALLMAMFERVADPAPAAPPEPITLPEGAVPPLCACCGERVAVALFLGPGDVLAPACALCAPLGSSYHRATPEAPEAPSVRPGCSRCGGTGWATRDAQGRATSGHRCPSCRRRR